MTRVELVLQALGMEIVTRRGSRGWTYCPFHKSETPTTFFVRLWGKRVGQVHCFSGETKVITWEGPKEIRSLVNQKVRLLSVNKYGRGKWVEAPIKSFGEQELWTVTIRRNGVRRQIRATSQHRWFVSPYLGVSANGKCIEVCTENLRPRMHLKRASLPRSWTLKPTPWGIAHGFTYGDGYCAKWDARVTLWGKKDACMERFFPGTTRYPVKEESGLLGLMITGLPFYFKKRPSIDEAPGYLYGWLAGYFAADGCVDEHGACILASADRTNLEFVRDVCWRLGIFTFDIRSQVRKGFADYPVPLYFLTLGRSTLDEEFFLIEQHRQRWLESNKVTERRGWVVESVERTGEMEEVFCASVPESHQFALDGFVMVGNCFSCKQGGSIETLVMHVRKIDFEEAQEFIDVLGQGFKPQSIRVVVKAKRANLGRQKFHMPSEIFYEPLKDWVKPARKYAEGRGITQAEVEEYRLGYTVEGQIGCRIVIPWIDTNGQFGGYSARTFVNEEPKYKTPKETDNADFGILVGEHLWHSRKLIVTTEGALNGYAVRRLYPNTNIGAMGGSEINPFHVIKLATFKHVVCLTDPDEAGDKAANQLRRQLTGYTKFTRVRLPDETDALDLQLKRPNLLRRYLDPVLG